MALRPIGLVDLEAHRKGAFGFHRLISNQGSEVGMQEFFEKLVLGGCPLVELSAAGRGVVRRHDSFVTILADDPDPEAPTSPILEDLALFLLGPDFQPRQSEENGPSQPPKAELKRMGVTVDELKVLGIDLACRSWADNGSALLSFGGVPPAWRACQVGAILWPDTPLSPAAMAKAIDAFTIANGVRAVSIDGPQGWRSPLAGDRPGVGRWCEYEARTPGKTGAYGRTYPGNYLRWVRFSINVFSELLALGRAFLVNEAGAARPLPVPNTGQYLLLECFPTSTWRCSGLAPLPGHRKAPPDVVERNAIALRGHYKLPAGAVTRHHDDLQALVAALPAAALLGGPCQAVPRGMPGAPQPSQGDILDHWIEGLIWDAQPTAGVGDALHLASKPNSLEAIAPACSPAAEEEADDANNPILPDERDAVGEEVIERGVRLFLELVRCANAGHSIGIGYADFVQWVYDASNFAEVAGRNYLPTDTGYVIRLAMAITDAAGGRQEVTKSGVTIACGMDSFIWQTRGNHDRPLEAWESRWGRLPYSRKDWLKVFPDGTRRLLDPSRRVDVICPG